MNFFHRGKRFSILLKYFFSSSIFLTFFIKLFLFLFFSYSCKFITFCQKSSKSSRSIYIKFIIPPNFSFFILSYYFIFSLYIDNDSSYLPYLIVIGYVMILFLLIRDIIFKEKFLDKYSHLFFYFCITFCLPFLSSYMLFYYANSQHGDYIWVINSLLTTFLLYQFFKCGCIFNKHEHWFFMWLCTLYV